MNLDWLQVRRVLSDTPLHKAHARLLERAPARTRRQIPWANFARDAFPERALELAADQALKLAEGEYSAVALFGQITAGLAMTAAPFDIVSGCASIGGDEIRHADYCAQLAQVCLGHEVVLEVPRHEVRRECGNAMDVEQLDYLLLKYSALGESLAAALLAECEAGAREPAARAMYGNLVRDEVHHARLGWYYFQWRAPRWTLAEKQRLADRIAEFLVGVEQEFHWGRDAPAAQQDAAAALGVLDTERQRLAIAALMERELIPGLDALGLGGSHAWAARRRGPPATPRRPARWVAAPAQHDPEQALTAASRWLAGQVREDGQLVLNSDPRGESAGHGEMHHGRSAVVLQALRARADQPEAAVRLERQLTRQLAAAHEGFAPQGWPLSQWTAAGSFALACLAGLPCQNALGAIVEQLAAEPEPRPQEAAWHAGQIATALGDACPGWIWQLCAAELDAGRWSPWATRAARVRGEGARARAGRDRLVQALMVDGGAPVTALVAAALEALALDPAPSDAALRAIERGRALLHGVQLGPEAGPHAGAFPLTGRDAMLRADVTAHALLALHATRPKES